MPFTAVLLQPDWKSRVHIFYDMSLFQEFLGQYIVYFKNVFSLLQCILIFYQNTLFT